MRKPTVVLVLAASAVYYTMTFVGLSLFQGFDPPLYFLVAPLLVLVLILANDLSDRAVVAKETLGRNPPSRKLSGEVQALTRQIEVGVRSSSAYFEKALVERLREVLAEKVALEMGMDLGRVRELLSNSQLGPGLLKNEQLYRLLYSGVPAKGPARVKMLEKTTALVESWKP